MFGKKKQINSVITNEYESIIPLTDGYDEMTYDAARFVIESGKASIGILQRKLHIGFNRAACIMDELYYLGIVGPEDGVRPRSVLVSLNQLDDIFDNLDKNTGIINSESISNNYSENNDPIAERYEIDKNSFLIELKRPQLERETFSIGNLRDFVNDYSLEVDYSKTATSPVSLNNTLIVNAKDDIAVNVITHLVVTYPEDDIQIIYMGDDVFGSFIGIPHVIHRFLNTSNSVCKVLAWASNHIQWRKDLFASNRVKSITEYNDLHKQDQENMIPVVAIVIEEIANIVDQTFIELLLQILLAGSRFGISIIMTSKLSQRSIKLGSCMDLIDITEPRGFMWYKPFNTSNSQITSHLDPFEDMTGLEFEHFCADLLSKNGFRSVYKELHADRETGC